MAPFFLPRMGFEARSARTSTTVSGSARTSTTVSGSAGTSTTVSGGARTSPTGSVNGGREPWFEFALMTGRGLMRGLDIDLRVTGVEHIPTDGAAIIASTHVSYPDFVPIAVAAARRGRYVRFFSRYDVWDCALLRRPMTRMGHIPVNRSVPAAAYLQARRLLREGNVVGGFPEAGISYSFAVRHLMRGMTALARETGAPLIPTALWGTQRVYTVGRPIDGKEPPPDFTRGRIVDLVFGEPIFIAPDADLTAATVALGHTLTDMLEELQTREHHRPRPGEYAAWYPAHLGGDAPCRDEALALDQIPRSAITPTWGPPYRGADA